MTLKGIEQLVNCLLCSLGFYDKERMRIRESSLMDGVFCKRKDCDWKQNPLTWAEATKTTLE